jgi:atypical dual specificity phosphatase
MATWWIDEPFLVGSSNPTDEELAHLRADGFALLVCLLDPTEQRPRYDIDAARQAGWSCHTIPIKDFRAPSIEQLDEFVRFVDGAGGQTKILVHCEGGFGRTGTMAAAYWIARGLTVAEAIARIRTARRGAVETEDQKRVLHRFAERLDRAPHRDRGALPEPAVNPLALAPRRLR